ncbi:hypothetical protein LSCM1_07633 [Leishmania martiniquensis]|uniref:Uncharacterized protein n=1 Tax=Leishmania martiniquensis TaxID=1580590 RepID=A0A836HWH2_9TRYP|nr:hypothetical protein LSCM1_07633 [Leishmania martiniquensis]
MLLFRHSAEQRIDGHEHHELLDGITGQDELANTHTTAAVADVGENETSTDVADGLVFLEESQSSDPCEDHENAPHLARERTVPPLDEREMVGQHHLDHGDDDEADATVAAPAASAPVPFNDVSALPTPRTAHAVARSGSNGNAVQRHGNYAYTPLGAAVSPRSASGISRGRSYSLGGLSAADLADARERHYRRCSSVITSARSLSARRASSLNGVVGVIDNFYTLPGRRGSAMTEGERTAVERMIEREYRRQEVVERSMQFALARESAVVEDELAREKASYVRRVHLDEELQARVQKSHRERQERMAAAAQRRQEQQLERQRALYDSWAEKSSRYHFRDPYTMMAMQRRYSIEARNYAAIAPQQRSSSLSRTKSNGEPEASRRASEGGMNGTTNDPCTSSPATGHRSFTPRIDMSKPRRCLPLDAWKLPAQQHKESRQRSYSAPRQGLLPQSWRAATVVDHPRGWH